MSAILEIEKLNRTYKDFSLKDVNLTLEKGFIMGFIGPNGAGKTTTIKLIMNLIRRDSGTIRIFGMDNRENELPIKDRIGFVYDENIFYLNLTVRQMKNIVAPFYSRWNDDRFASLLRKFDILETKKVKDLSRGMRMKFSLAVALSHGAELLIMDEPTSGLDPIVRSELLEILSGEIQDENKAVFFSTHITSDLDKIADYVTLIDGGKVLFSKPMDELRDVFALVKGPNDLAGVEAEKAFVGMKRNQFGFEALAKDRNEARRLFGDRVVIERPTLEDVMLYFTRRSTDA